MKTPSIFRVAVCGGAVALGAAGCTTVRTTDPPSTATQEYLISTAISHAVHQLDTDCLRGKSVFVEDKYVPASNQPMVIGEVRAQLLELGARLQNDRKLAKVIVEVRTMGIGIDRTESMVGIPAIPLGAIAGASSGAPVQSLSTPELAVVKETNQWSAASIGIIAYDAESGRMLMSAGPLLGRGHRDDHSYFGFSGTDSDIAPALPPGEPEGE